MEYCGRIKQERVRIVAKSGWLQKYYGQECDATLYEPGMNIHLNTEQLNPPLPKMQSANELDVVIIR